jgi:transposase-like protein
MSQRSAATSSKPPAEQVVRDIRRAARKQHSSEEKIRIVLEGLRGEDSIAPCAAAKAFPRACITPGRRSSWVRRTAPDGKRRLAGDTARAATIDEVKALRQEARALKEVVAEQTLELRLLEKSMSGAGEDPAWDTRGPEKLEIIRRVKQSHLPVRRTLRHLGIPPATFYRWYTRYQTGGPEALADLPSRPDRVWNRIPDEVRARIIDLALAETELSPRELAVRFTDRERHFVSEASVYRLLKAHDLITSLAFIVIKAADEFHTKTNAPNQLWQTDFTDLKVAGWGWFYLSTVLDDFSRYVIA